VPQIEVTFDIDANGIVHVTAKDLGTGKEQKIRIESSSGLTEDEINQMVKDAEQHAEEDKRLKETVEVRNQADSLIYSTEKTLQENGEKISDDERAGVQEKIDALRSAMDQNDLDSMRSGIEALQNAVQPLAQKIYQEQNAQQHSGAGAAGGTGGAYAGNSGSSDGSDSSVGVEDADYEVVDD
jgi:molecular chaperone DnaK